MPVVSSPRRRTIMYGRLISIAVMFAVGACANTAQEDKPLDSAMAPIVPDGQPKYTLDATELSDGTGLLQLGSDMIELNEVICDPAVEVVGSLTPDLHAINHFSMSAGGKSLQGALVGVELSKGEVRSDSEELGRQSVFGDDIFVWLGESRATSSTSWRAVSSTQEPSDNRKRLGVFAVVTVDENTVRAVSVAEEHDAKRAGTGVAIPIEVVAVCLDRDAFEQLDERSQG